MKRLAVLLPFLVTANAFPLSQAKVKTLRVTTLSTGMADWPDEADAVAKKSGGESRGLRGEWGFAALVEADGKRILFDTGSFLDTVLKNADALGIDLSDVETVVLSHHDADHTGGLVALRQELEKRQPGAANLRTVHVAQGFFNDRKNKPESGDNMFTLKKAFEATGGRFKAHNKPAELFPGVWITGPVPRLAENDEKNWDGDDQMPEDQALVANTAEGLVVLTGCAHAGIMNTMDYAAKTSGASAIHAALGGFHLYLANSAIMRKVSEKLKKYQVKYVLGSHCTGIERLVSLRNEVTGLDSRTAVNDSVGTRFELGKGIIPVYMNAPVAAP